MAEFTKVIAYKVDCPACQGSHVVKIGERNGSQRYRCNGCKKVFRADGKANGRKYDAELVGATIFEVVMGLSIRNSSRNITNRYGFPRPSTDTIHSWIKDYTEAATYALRDVKAHTGDRWVADEMVIDVDGEKVYHWNIMDRDTRFLLASHVSRSRGEDAATEAFKKALARADHPPKSVRTDKWVAYPPTLRKLMPNTKHVQSKGVAHWINNNLSERMQGTYRQRVKTARGFGSVANAQQFLDAFNVTYNYFNDHGSLRGRTPGQVAAVENPFTEWADVVRADVVVPEHWKRKPAPRMHRAKRYAGHTQKGYRARPRKRREDKPQSHRVQLGFFRRKKPTKRDREKVAMAVEAPRPVMPDAFKKPTARPFDTQLQMMSRRTLTIPKRTLPKLPSRTRK